MAFLTASRHISKGILSGAIITMGLLSGSCNSIIYEDEGDCSVHYKLRFKYTRNILNADAFSSQVTDLHVSLYDSDGKMVYHKSERRTPTESNDYYMDIDVFPGKYDIIAWCDGRSVIENAVSFNLKGQQIGDDITSSGAQFDLLDRNGDYYYDKDLNRLYYGRVDDVTFPESIGDVVMDPIPLVKDTNHITVILQNMDGTPIDSSILTFSIEGRNNSLDWENNIDGTTTFKYYPWDLREFIAEVGEETATRSELPSGVKAEFTTGRLLSDVEQRLTVKLDTGETIFSIPLVKYLLFVRDEYKGVNSDQDYLDRYDDFTMVFFVGNDYSWIKSHIYINGWRVVPPQNENL